MWVRHDAISNSLGLKVQFFDRLQAAGANIAVDVFVHDGDDHSDRRIRRHRSLRSLLGDPRFGTADLHIFEFGIHYALFDAVYFLKQDRPTLGVFHNVTPPHLATTADARALLERSLRQRENLAQTHHVMCDSEFNRQDLLRIGLPEEMLSVVHLPCSPSVEPASTAPTDDPDEPVSILYVGRLVAAKGLYELVAAVRRLAARGERRFRVTVTGKRAFSEDAVIRALEQAAADPVLAGLFVLADEPNDDELSAMYAAADAVVIPSHHEGFCVPVVEAYLHNCFVITSDAGNLPSIVGDCGTTYPVGDAASLAAALGRYIDVEARRRTGKPVRLPAPGNPTFSEFSPRVARHTAAYSPAAFERGLMAAVTRTVAAAGQVPADWMSTQQIDAHDRRRYAA